MIFYKESSFQETPIGKIPSDWTVIKLEKVLHLRNGERPKISDGGDVPVFGANGIMGYTNEVLVDNEFTIVVGRVGASGQVHLGKGKIWVSDNAIYSENYDNKRAHPPFLFYLLHHRKLDQFASKTTHPIITQTFLNNFLIHLPPLEEQKRIAEILGVVDSVIAKTGEVIAKTERLKKGLMQTLLTRGIGHKEYKQTPIGTIPKTWQIESLSNVFKLASGKPRPSEISEKATQKTPYPVYGGNGILGYANEFLLDQETIVIGRVGEYCGSVYKTTKFSWITDNALYATEISKDFNLEFLKYLLNFLNLNKFKKKMGQPLLTQTIIYSIDIQHPPLPEQQKIADVLLTIDRKLEIEKNEKARLERVKRGLMDLLLTGKIRVKVD
jgi:type I restriction enzyme S subunit